jgi:hypothetical protein
LERPPPLTVLVVVVFKFNCSKGSRLAITDQPFHYIKPMPVETFSILGQFTVFRSEDGAITWSGSYRTMKISAAFLIDDERCIILLDPGASKQEVFENLLCLESSGSMVWKAELPDQPDVFVKFEIAADGLQAWTWSGWVLRLELTTGKILERHFVK